MQWLILTYSLPTGPNSSPRVTLWRRLRRLGAITVTGGAYILPTNEECREAFQWLAQEIRQAQGEALVLHGAEVDGLSDAELTERFRAARRKDYSELEEQITALEQQIAGDHESRTTVSDGIERLRRRLAETARVDYFDCPEGHQLAVRLEQLAATVTGTAAHPAVTSAPIATYQGRRWVTRSHPHVDRLACIWLIRRFIDRDAPIRYGPRPEDDEVSFDMDGATFGHTGNLCTFETMLHTFGLDGPALQTLAEIVHEIDLRDGQYIHPEIRGIDAVLDGWLRSDAEDAERERWGIGLFEGLYQGLQQSA